MQHTPVPTNLTSLDSKPLQPKLPGNTTEKEFELRRLMRDLGKVLVAYSGGVDSTYLAFIAHRELGDKAVSVLGISPSVSSHQVSVAKASAERIGFDLVTIETHELDDEHYSANPSNRCYFCKTELYGRLTLFAAERGVQTIVDGTNFDDLADVRPGRRAAYEKCVRSPLAEVGMTKDEIRLLSRAAGLPGWERPASPCLSSRIAYGVPVTIERLSKVERAEEFIRRLGFSEFRVRVHGELARIEIAPDELDKACNPEFAARAAAALSEIGFKYVTLDLRGFRSGSMN